MALILHINTAQEEATVALSENNIVIEIVQNQKNHAGFLQSAIQKIIQHSAFSIQHIDAVEVVAGPGSYTGLRIGLASAKGLCYALNIPLITLNTLKVMAAAAISLSAHQSTTTLFCPMIDARRNEVFTAVYDNKLNAVLKPCAIVLNEESFMDIRKNYEFIVFGSGAAKWNAVYTNSNTIEISTISMVYAQVLLAHTYFKNKVFADTAYAEPFYLKDFYNPAQKKSI